MPWGVFSERGLWCVHKLKPDGTRGPRVACHDSKPAADAQVKALYANEPSAQTSGTMRG